MRTNCTVSAMCILALCSVLALFMIPAPPPTYANTWTTGGPADSVGSIAVAPSNNQVVYAVGSGGLWKTTNGGANWNHFASSSMASDSPLAIDPSDPLVVYGKGKGTMQGIIKSTDGAQTWSLKYPVGGVTALTIDPSNPQTVYAGIKPQSSTARIIKSTNGGNNWAPVTDVMQSGGPGDRSVVAFTSFSPYPGSQPAIVALVTDYHGGGLMRTVDGGATWTSSGAPAGLSLHTPTALSIGTIPSAGPRIYSGWTLMGSKGLGRSDDGGITHTNISSGLPPGGGTLSSLVITENYATVLAALVGNSANGIPGGVFLSTNSGDSWTDLALPSPVNKIAYGAQSHIIYASTGNGVWQYTMGSTPGPGPGPGPAPGPLPPVNPISVAPVFLVFYNTYDGMRLLGAPISQPVNAGAYYSQYFEKGRMEDHSLETSDLNWRFMYGLLVDELQTAGVNLPVGGDTSTASYATIKTGAAISQRVAAPAGFTGGSALLPNGNTFVPFTADLSPAPGHNIYGPFWGYINDGGLFPGGWLHDIGLPITEPMSCTVTKAGLGTRNITVQAFQRTILTYDPANPPEWRTERANVGSDFKQAFPTSVPN
jgi:hypothetical protein